MTQREIFATLDSTNAEAMRQALSGRKGPVWFLAREQTGARGRRGRAWHMGAGNFAASLLMHPCSTETAALRSFVAALALRDALVKVTGETGAFALKWPNDVLLRGRKLAGILLESGCVDQQPFLVVGIGVNLASAPASGMLEAGAVQPASLCGVFGTRIAPEEFLDLLDDAFTHWNGVLESEGFEPVRRAWMKYAARLGLPMVARLPNASHEGLFEGIDAEGALVLATDRGRIALRAADVHFAPEGAV